MREYPALFAFNRGLVSPLGLARSDQKRVALSAETMTNWIARVLGSMSLRPGLGYLGRTASDNAPRYIPFIFATNDTSLVEFTDSTMRVWINDVLLARAAVNSTVSNGAFSGNIIGWTDGSDVGGTVAWAAGNYLSITGNGTARGIAYQQVSVALADRAVEHGLKIIIKRGPVTFQVGTTSTTDDIVGQTTLETGSHSIAFTPNGANFYIQFQSTAIYKILIQQCTVEAAGTVTITSPYLAADLGNIRFDGSGDIVYLACAGFQQRQIQRRGTRPGARSWSIVLYHADDGPFRTENLTQTTIAAGAATGDVTLTASRPLFNSSQVGSLFSLTANSAQQTVTATGENQFTSPSVKVTGTAAQRLLSVTITGTWVATITVQQSIGVDGAWVDFVSYTTNQAATPLNDGLDNQIVYYRIGIKVGGYTSGTATCQLNYANGSQTGIVRVTAFTSSTSVDAQVLAALGGTTATTVWAEGTWSDYRGWPTAVRFHEGRLWWSGKSGVWGSVSDGFYSFDETVEGDSAPIARTIGSGPVDTINWILSLQRMVLGAQGAEISVRSSSLDTPLTPTDFVMKFCSTQGSGAVEPARIDQNAIYVDRTGIRIFQLEFDFKNYLSPDYSSIDLTAIVPELALPGIVRMDVQRKPDTRIHCIRSDGTVMLGVLDKVEDVLAWLEVETDGAIEDVVILPAANGSTEDQVYYAVARTINGATVRHLEKWAKETECRGGTLNKQADAFVTFTNSSASTTVSGLGHLVGESVVVWQDGTCPEDASGDVKTFTVSAGGTITLDTAATTGIVGLPYTGQWQSAKLGLQASIIATTLNQQKRISHLGLVAAWLHPKGIQHGPDFDHLDDLPGVERGTAVPSNTIRTAYDEQEFVFPGLWETDSRLCLQANAPRPATILAAIPDLDIHG